MTNPYDALAKMRAGGVVRPLSGFDHYMWLRWQVAAVAAIVAPPGQEAQAVDVVRRLLARPRYAPPQSESLNAPPEDR